MSAQKKKNNNKTVRSLLTFKNGELNLEIYLAPCMLTVLPVSTLIE